MEFCKALTIVAGEGWHLPANSTELGDLIDRRLSYVSPYRRFNSMGLDRQNMVLVLTNRPDALGMPGYRDGWDDQSRPVDFEKDHLRSLAKSLTEKVTHPVPGVGDVEFQVNYFLLPGGGAHINTIEWGPKDVWSEVSDWVFGESNGWREVEQALANKAAIQ